MIIGVLFAWLMLLGPQQSTITFDYRFPPANPAEYHITIHDDGTAIFEEPESEAQNAYRNEFQLSRELKDKIFSQARQLNGVSGDLDAHKRKIADTGERRISYTDGSGTQSAVFHYTENRTLQEVTAEFSGIALAQDFIRKVQFDRRFDRLALDQDIQQFSDAVSQHRAMSLESVRPLLQSISEDETAMKIVRERAKDLLTRISAPQ